MTRRDLHLVSWSERCGGDLTIGDSRLTLGVVLQSVVRHDDAVVTLQFPSLDPTLLPLLRQLVHEVRLAIEDDDGPSRRLQSIRELLEEGVT